MAFIVEYTFVRPNADTAWPEFTEVQQSQIQSLRDEHNIATLESISEDGLTKTLRQSAENQHTYTPFYNQGQPIWEAAGIVYRCEQDGIDLSLNIVENTF